MPPPYVFVPPYFPTIRCQDFKLDAKYQRLDINLNTIKQIFEDLGIDCSNWRIIEKKSRDDLPVDLYIQTTVAAFFLNKGFSKEQVAGIMGNVMQESGWNPLLRDSGSPYWGLFQVGQSLSKDLEKSYSSAGLDMAQYGYNVSKYQGIGAQAKISRNDLTTMLDIQLNFIYTCKPTESEWITPLKKATSASEAAEVFLVMFEGAKSEREIQANKLLYFRAGSFYQEAEKRRGYAEGYLKNLKEWEAQGLI
jgi:hypothetical protein